MKEQKKEIDLLEKERKQIEKKIKRVKRRLSVCEFFTQKITTTNRHGRRRETPLGAMFGGILSVVSIIVVGSILQLSFTMLLVGLGLSLTPLIGACVACGIMSNSIEKCEDKLFELGRERKDLLNYIDSVKNVKSSSKNKEEVITGQKDSMQPKTSLLENVRLRDVERAQQEKIDIEITIEDKDIVDDVDELGL